MINILSIRCGLAFAPYLERSARAFLLSGDAPSRVVRQGGSGLIIRSDASLKLRYQNNESELDRDDVRHYQATIAFRAEFYDLLRMSDEVVLGSVGNHLLLSHPQSEMWLEPDTVSSLLDCAKSGCDEKAALPDWLSVSTGAERLLLSDQRTGRWVLLGSDHLAEMERRSSAFYKSDKAEERLAPPSIMVKGMSVRLQSSFHLSGVLERFAETGEIDPFEESYGGIHLRVSRSSEGVEISDGEIRAGMNGREARKWAAVIIGELERFRACQTERSRIRTVFADGQNGRWVLQWGDEVFAPFEMIETIKTGQGSALPDRSRRVVSKRAEGLLIILDQATGGCVALDEPESASLFLHRLNGQDLQD